MVNAIFSVHLICVSENEHNKKVIVKLIKNDFRELSHEAKIILLKFLLYYLDQKDNINWMASDYKQVQ